MRLLTAVSLVRVQLGELWLRGQAVKTSPFHGGNTGSIPVGVIYADVAQLAEQLICNQQVIGSSPIIGLGESQFHMDGFPSGQRGQTVNLLRHASVVRIHLHPLQCESAASQSGNHS